MIQPDICAPRELSNGALEDEIATLAAHIAAAEYRFLCLVASLLVGVAVWCWPERGAREGESGAGS